VGPSLADQIEDRGDVPAFVKAETRPLSAAFSVRSVIEGDAANALGRQENDPPQHFFAIVAEAVK
jgi:hypothetical protein